MGIFVAPIVPEMTQEIKEKVRYEELERVLFTIAKEIRMLKERVKILEERK